MKTIAMATGPSTPPSDENRTVAGYALLLAPRLVGAITKSFHAHGSSRMPRAANVGVIRGTTIRQYV
jgi:hypothetical protein